MSGEKNLTLQCMEIWGGNHLTEEYVSLAGLDAWVLSRPHGNATDGGDVHFVSSCATGRITRMLIADVSGHGEDVASIAEELRFLMRRYVNYISQDRFLAEVNSQFMQRSSQGRFATAVAMTYFSPTNELVVCNAGHPRPIVYRQASSRWEVMQQQHPEQNNPVNIPLGVTHDVDYVPVQTRLSLGDRLLCYTDSLTEARYPDGSFFGEQGLCDLLNSLSIDDENDFIQLLLDGIAEKTGTPLKHDDLTVMLMKPNINHYKVPLSVRMKAPLLMMKGMAKSLVSKEYPMPLAEMTVKNIGGALLDVFNRARLR